MDKLKAYSVLGLAQNATEEEIKTAYRTLAQKYSMENYEAGPLRQDAEDKMNEINDAFDTLMGMLRTENTPSNTENGASGQTGGNLGRYTAIRQLINQGRADEALAELNAIPGGSTDAEWNFLMGSAYYYKGWLEQALRYFQEAARIEPSNREYQAALRNLTGNGLGNMPGNPYSAPDGSETAMNCACNTCSLMCCMDACCSMCRGM